MPLGEQCKAGVWQEQDLANAMQLLAGARERPEPIKVPLPVDYQFGRAALDEAPAGGPS